MNITRGTKFYQQSSRIFGINENNTNNINIQNKVKNNGSLSTQ
jgi:hypothetical protein